IALRIAALVRRALPPTLQSASTPSSVGSPARDQAVGRQPLPRVEIGVEVAQVRAAEHGHAVH
ncbi:MAG: hypothetical protein ABSG43_31015, partial [Solirubrobacteraceae bacterium]